MNDNLRKEFNEAVEKLKSLSISNLISTIRGNKDEVSYHMRDLINCKNDINSKYE